jgi:hypothetical protein
MIGEVIKKWRDVSPGDITSKPNWEEGWRLEHGNVLKVHNLRGVSKMSVDEGKLPMIRSEIVATIAEIEEKYEDLREFETLSKEDEEVRSILVRIRDKLEDLQSRLFYIPFLLFAMTPLEMLKEVEELVKSESEGIKQIDAECTNAKVWINFTLALSPNLASSSTISALNQISGLHNLIPKLRFLRIIYEG